MDPNATDYGQGAANTASQNATNMAQSLPTVLNDLKGSLNSIFNTNNPLMQERTGMLSNYLSAGDQARASYLPTHSGFAFSPTELNAMVSSRQASALAPLAGVNNMIMGQYGGLNDYLGTAKDIFAAKVQAAQADAQRLWQQYQANAAAHQQDLANQLEQQKFGEGVRQFNLLHGGSGTGTSGLSGLGFNNGINTNNVTSSAYGPTRSNWQPSSLPPTSQNAATNSLNYMQGQNLNSSPGLFQNILNYFKPQAPITTSPLNITGPLNINPSGIGYGGY